MKSIYHVSVIVGVVAIMAFGGLRSGALRMAPTVWAADADAQNGETRRVEPCSLRGLKGSYGFTTTGSILSAGPVGLIADVGVLKFDGRGGVSQIETLSLNGVIVPERFSQGEYFVEPSCTGDMVLTLPPPAGESTSHFVIVDEGKELRLIVTGAGRVLTTIARRQ